VLLRAVADAIHGSSSAKTIRAGYYTPISARSIATPARYRRTLDNFASLLGKLGIIEHQLGWDIRLRVGVQL